MANGNTTTTPGSTVSTGGLNYDDYQKRIQDAAARTRNVEWPSAGVDKLRRLRALSMSVELGMLLALW